MKINYADSNLNCGKCVMENVATVECLLSKINEIKSKKDRKHYVIQLTSEEYSLTDTLDLTALHLGHSIDLRNHYIDAIILDSSLAEKEFTSIGDKATIESGIQVIYQ